MKRRFLSIESFDPHDPLVYRRHNNTFLVNQMTLTVDVIRDVIIPFLQDHPDITTLNLYKNNIGPKGTKLLAEFLQANTTIKSLIISDNHIGSEGVFAIASLLASNKTLNEINLTFNHIDEDGAKVLATAMSHNTTLSGLNLRDNPIGDKGALSLYQTKRSASNLQGLLLDDEYAYLSDENIDQLIAATHQKFGNTHWHDPFGWKSKKGIKGLTFAKKTHSHPELTPINPKIIVNILIPYFNTHPEVTALYLDEVNLNTETIDALILLIQSSNTVKSIKIFDFEPLGYRTIFSLKQAAKEHLVSLVLPYHYRDVNSDEDLIKRNKSIDPNTLDLSSSGCLNHCEWGGYMNIASQDIIDIIIPYLKIHPNITTLILDKNRNITNGIIALAVAETNLTTLSVNECRIKSAGMRALANHAKFINLDISGNHHTDDDLAMLVKHNPNLKTLQIKYAVVDKRQQFAEAVKVIADSKITNLNFYFHNLGGEQIKYLAQSKTIKILNLHNNNITDETLALLAKNEVITNLNLSSNEHLTDAGLHQFLTINKALTKLNLSRIENVGDLTAIALAQHPSMREVNLEHCTQISEIGIRALVASRHLKIIKYRGYSWDDDKFFPLLAENDPHKNTSLPENFYINQHKAHKKSKHALKGETLEKFFIKVDQANYNALFQVPTLFSLAGAVAKKQLIKNRCSEFTLSWVEDNINLCLIPTMDPSRMTTKKIYICSYNPSDTYSKSGYQYQLLGTDGAVKRGVIYRKNLPIEFGYQTTANIVSNARKFLPELLKHIIAAGHINLFSPEDMQQASNDVQKSLSQCKL